MYYLMVQNDVLMFFKGMFYFNMVEYQIYDLYNEYFGYGLLLIVFQEIWEVKVLVYSIYVYYNSLVKVDCVYYLCVYVGI